MELVKTLLIVVNAIMGISVIVLVLLQKGKGAEAGATFGGGAGGSASIFGAAGAANFLSRSTAICATIFFVSALGLGYISAKTAQNLGVVSSVDAQTEQTKIPDGFTED